MGRVKIYGTIGPSCSDPEVIRAMLREGMDGIRLNLSHTTLDDAAGLIGKCHSAARDCGVRIELLIDMQGPELRTGSLKEPISLKDGALIGIDHIPLPGNVVKVISEKDPGQDILLDDGRILLRTEYPGTGSSLNGLSLRIIRGGMLNSRKSIALPGCHIETPAMTENDKRQIRRAADYGVTAVMQPFVRSKEDLIEVRSALDQAGCKDIHLFAKIENRDGMDRLEELIPHCGQIVIARGDLGNSMELWELPAAQKRVSAACRSARREFMVVTQMLDSMMHRQVPTRAEVSDIFNSVLDGAASVMVTGETAAGDYPALAIRYLAKTVREAELYLEGL